MKNFIRFISAVVLIVFLFLQMACLDSSLVKDKGMGENEDLYDTLLLYDPGEIRNSDINFSMISEYYGLRCKKIDIIDTPLTPEIFHDLNGNYFKAIYINACNVERSSLIDEKEILLLKNIIKDYGVKLFIGETLSDNEQNGHINLKKLINDENINISSISSPCYSWAFSDRIPFLTKEFTGQKLQSSKQIENDSVINTSESSGNIKVILSQVDNKDTELPIFLRYASGKGEMFIQSGILDSSLQDKQMYTLYDIDNLSALVPMMMFIKYALGNECWHNNNDYENLTIDDPSLSDSFHESLVYSDLLDKMRIYNFHTTIGFSARNWNDSQEGVVELFLQNPDLFSLVIHGNNHDGYEFYKYSVQKGDEFEARPIDEQESDIIFALFQMELHKKITGIPFSRIMIFPYGISPEDTLLLLKKYNFNATINAQDIPLDAIKGTNYDYNMYQAIMNYANFPVIKRNPLNQDSVSVAVFNAFIDKPILYYTHVGEDFKDTIDLTQQVNEYGFDIQWRSLDFILKHLYLEKLNDDDSIDLKIYGNDLVVANESNVKRTYHIKKEEKSNVPIKKVTVNGENYNYRIVDDILCLDIGISAESIAELKIIYGQGSLLESIYERFFIIKCIASELANKLYTKVIDYLT